MIKREQTAQDFFAGGRADRVADAVVFGQGFDFVEVVAEVEGLSPVRVADGFVELAVQAAEFADALVAGFGLICQFLADVGYLGRCEVHGCGTGCRCWLGQARAGA